MQHFSSYFHNTNNYNLSSNSSSLCSSQYTSSSKSSSSENTRATKKLSSSYRSSSCNKILPMICLPIHTSLPPVHMTFPKKADPRKVSLIQEILINKSSQNSPTSSSKNMNIRQIPTSSNSISSTISSHSSKNGSSSQVSNNSPNHPVSDKSIKKRSIDNPYITDNLLYGDPIIEHFYPSSRIIYNNVNELDLSTHSATLRRCAIICTCIMSMLHVYLKQTPIGRIHDDIIQCLVSSGNFGRDFK